MPNQRGENQKLLTVPVDVKFITELDRNLKACGYSNRSQFVRDAIIEKLIESGIPIPKTLGLAPGRTPKSGLQLNEVSSANVEAAKEQIVDYLAKKIKKRRKT